MRWYEIKTSEEKSTILSVHVVIVILLFISSPQFFKTNNSTITKINFDKNIFKAQFTNYNFISSSARFCIHLFYALVNDPPLPHARLKVRQMTLFPQTVTNGSVRIGSEMPEMHNASTYTQLTRAFLSTLADKFFLK